jgi:transcriptional regulator with XRE-family HTH domain
MDMQVIDLLATPAEHPIVLRGIQIRLARVALGWGQQMLADRANLGIATIQRAERAEVPPLTVANLLAIQRAFEAAGIIFIEDGEQSLSGGPGIRLQRRP